MECFEIESLCDHVAAAVSEVRRVFRSCMPVPEILDRFWALQDNASRLLEAMSDEPAQTMRALQAYPRLLADVLDVLEFSSKLQTLKSIPAVREAVESINDSLIEIHSLTQSRAMAACQ